jgi:hypothetical protein
MTTTARYNRKAWGARKRRRHPGTLDPHQVKGIALHWPGMAHPLGNVKAVVNALRSWQAFHMDDRGWSDIAYQVAVDQAGNRYRLRGLRNRSAANGNTQLNLEYGAVLLVLAEGEEPSEAMVSALRDVIAEHRKIFPRSEAIVGHGQIRPGGTDCPGPAVRALIGSGRLRPTRKAVR